MNPDDDADGLAELENQLRALQPLKISAHLKAGLAARLKQLPPERLVKPSRCRVPGTVAAGVGLAACLGFALLPRLRTPPAAQPAVFEPYSFETARKTRPNWWQYQLALARSTDNLNALMEAHETAFQVDRERDEVKLLNGIVH